MNINDAFPGTYLKADDLKGQEVTVSIDRVAMEDIGGEHKPVLYFQGKDRGMVLNKTNSTNIASMYGPETDAWTGKRVTLFTAHVDFQGKTVPAIRIKPSNAGQPAPQTAEDYGGDPKDEIPF